jgi:hypothetical protein
MIKPPQVSLRQLLLAVTIVAAGLGVHLGMAKQSQPVYPLWLGWYLLALAVATVLACGKPGARMAYQISATFGWAYLICVLRAGFGLVGGFDAIWLVGNAQLGLGLLGVSLLIGWFVTPRGESPPSETHSEDKA